MTAADWSLISHFFLGGLIGLALFVACVLIWARFFDR